MHPITLISPLAAIPLALAHSARSPSYNTHRPARMNFNQRQYDHYPGRRAQTTSDSGGNGLLGQILGTASSTSSSSTSQTLATQSSDSTSTITSTTSSTSSLPNSSSSSLSSTNSGIVFNTSSVPSSVTSSSHSTTSTLLATSTSPSSIPSFSSSTNTQASTQYTTDAAGQTQVVTVIYTASASSTSSSISSTAASQTAIPTNNGTISTPAIVGIAVGVGAVVLALIGLALWRMRRSRRDEDEAIRWPELNRHGDTSTQHALPARRTGQHGFETNALERSLTNSSDTYPIHNDSYSGPVPMALNGSSFGAASLLADEYDEKQGGTDQHGHYVPDEHELSTFPTDHHSVGGAGAASGYEFEEDYTSFPPIVQHQGGSTHGYENDTDDEGMSGGRRSVDLDTAGAGHGQPVPYNLDSYHHV